MKIKTTLVYFFSFLSVFVFGQQKELQLDAESFLMGTLSDYNGRIVRQDDTNKIDTYGFFEQSLAGKIHSLFAEEYNDLSVNKIESKDLLNVSSKLYSKKLAEKINSNYAYKVYGWTQSKDTIFTGKLKHGIFETELQKISFIIGAYSRFGEKKNEKYCIRLLNSFSKFAECEKILKELDCEKIEIEIIKNIPANQLIYFQLSEKLELYFENYEYLRNQILKDRDELLEERNKKYNK